MTRWFRPKWCALRTREHTDKIMKDSNWAARARTVLRKREKPEHGQRSNRLRRCQLSVPAAATHVFFFFMQKAEPLMAGISTVLDLEERGWPAARRRCARKGHHAIIR